MHLVGPTKLGQGIMGSFPDCRARRLHRRYLRLHYPAVPGDPAGVLPPLRPENECIPLRLPLCQNDRLQSLDLAGRRNQRNCLLTPCAGASYDELG